MWPCPKEACVFFSKFRATSFKWHGVNRHHRIQRESLCRSLKSFSKIRVWTRAISHSQMFGVFWAASPFESQRLFLLVIQMPPQCPPTSVCMYQQPWRRGMQFPGTMLVRFVHFLRLIKDCDSPTKYGITLDTACTTLPFSYMYYTSETEREICLNWGGKGDTQVFPLEDFTPFWGGNF